MKKGIVLLIALLSLAGCSNAKDSTTAKGGHKTTYCSCYEPNPTPSLDTYGLLESNKIDATFGELRSHQHLFENNDDYVLFDNYQSVTTFVNDLEQKSASDNYNETIKFLNGVQENQFENKKLIMTQQFELRSGGYSRHFDAAYLKEDTLYLHNFRYDQDSPDARDKNFTMDIVYTCGYVWIDKSVNFTNFRVLSDIDVRQPMVIELD